MINNIINTSFLSLILCTFVILFTVGFLLRRASVSSGSHLRSTAITAWSVVRLRPHCTQSLEIKLLIKIETVNLNVGHQKYLYNYKTFRKPTFEHHRDGVELKFLTCTVVFTPCSPFQNTIK